MREYICDQGKGTRLLSRLYKKQQRLFEETLILKLLRIDRPNIRPTMKQIRII